MECGALTLGDIKDVDELKAMKDEIVAQEKFKFKMAV